MTLNIYLSQCLQEQVELVSAIRQFVSSWNGEHIKTRPMQMLLEASSTGDSLQVPPFTHLSQHRIKDECAMLAYVIAAEPDSTDLHGCLSYLQQYCGDRHPKPLILIQNKAVRLSNISEKSLMDQINMKEMINSFKFPLAYYDEAQDLLDQLRRHLNQYDHHTSNPTFSAIRMDRLLRLLQEGLTIDQFDEMMISHFPDAYRQLGPGMTQSARIMHLVTHAKCYGKLDDLLALMNNINPYQYGINAPYK